MLSPAHCEIQEKIKVKRLLAKEACIKRLKVFKLDTNSLVLNDLKVDTLTVGGFQVEKLLAPVATSVDLPFDALVNGGFFGDRTPKKPDGVNETVWNSMLDQLKNRIIPKLGARLEKGRQRLGLPKVLNDVDLVGTISIQPFFKSFPNDPSRQDIIQFYTGIGWDMEVANAAGLLTAGEDLQASLFTGSITGNILTVTNVSFGLVSQGLKITAPGLPEGVMIVDQLTNDPIDGPFFKTGTFLLNTSLNLSSREFRGVFPSGPRVASIYLYYGYMEKETGQVVVKTYDLTNRQFEPTIDYDPEDDPQCVDSWGEKFGGYRPVASHIIYKIAENMRGADGKLDINNTGCMQLAILRETGIIAYFPGGCSDDDRAISTVITNPSCINDCSGNATSSASTTVSVTGIE